MGDEAAGVRGGVLAMVAAHDGDVGRLGGARQGEAGEEVLHVEVVQHRDARHRQGGVQDRAVEARMVAEVVEHGIGRVHLPQRQVVRVVLADLAGVQATAGGVSLGGPGRDVAAPGQLGQDGFGVVGNLRHQGRQGREDVDAQALLGQA